MAQGRPAKQKRQGKRIHTAAEQDYFSNAQIGLQIFLPHTQPNQDCLQNSRISTGHDFKRSEHMFQHVQRLTFFTCFTRVTIFTISRCSHVDLLYTFHNVHISHIFQKTI